MKIELRGTGPNYREVIFVSAEDDETLARSVMLDRHDALDLADDLQTVAEKLTRWAWREPIDDRQATLPLFGFAA